MFSSFAPKSSPLSQHQNGSPYYYDLATNDDQTREFDIQDFLDDQTCEFDFQDFLDDHQLLTDKSNYQELIPTHFGIKEHNLASSSTHDQNPVILETITTGSSSKSSHNTNNVSFMHPPNNFNIDDDKRERVHAKFKLALRMKTTLEVIDDGYKWRKYGKKKVKSSPYPRNYFKCSTIGCNVKKRIERDINDSSYVITAYDGVHNHKGSFDL